MNYTTSFCLKLQRLFTQFWVATIFENVTARLVFEMLIIWNALFTVFIHFTCIQVSNQYFGTDDYESTLFVIFSLIKRYFLMIWESIVIGHIEEITNFVWRLQACTKNGWNRYENWIFLSNYVSYKRINPSLHAQWIYLLKKNKS